VSDVGTPIADVADAPSDTLDGLGSGGVTIEMGSLYASGETPPPDTGDLLTLTVSGPCNVSIAENVIRGGIVLEDPSLSADPTLGSCQVTVGCPCLGDTDTDDDIDLSDLMAIVNRLVAAGSPFRIPVGPGDCADMDQDGDVDLSDLMAVVNMLTTAGSPFRIPCP
jgi:hypothetical protein